ncbi:pantetheine-phosphate adenylyltransferase [soil metagenome]
MTVAVYPGSFDPVTTGHVDLASRAARLFDHVVVGIYAGSRKPGAMFNVNERVAMARDALHCFANISVDSFSGLTVEFAREQQATAIVRGLRALSDFEYEFKLTHMNHHLAPEIEVVCLMTSSKHSFVSSSMIREVASLGGDVSALVPPAVNTALRERFGQQTPNRGQT